MLVVDELKKNEPQLRLVAVMLAGGLCILFAGLWWVQVVSASDYQQHLETQSYRTIRLPAVRGKILDRDGRVLAENRPTYNLSVYLDDLRTPFYQSYTNLLAFARAAQRQKIDEAEKKLGHPLSRAELKQYRFSSEQIQWLQEQARDRVMQQLADKTAKILGQPVPFDEKDFNRHYYRERALPYPILEDLNNQQIARFEENYTPDIGIDLEVESTRYYPYGTTAGHLLGYVLRDDEAKKGENSFFNYYLPDYRGVVGMEAALETDLRGRAGEASVLVNSLGYRQSINIDTPPEPGHNAVLTLDLDIQQAAEKAVLDHRGPDARAAVVVMDVHNGNVLAMVSSPLFNPDYSKNDPARMHDATLRPAINRATQEKLAPGSIFKPIVGLAALEAGLNPQKEYVVEPNPAKPWASCVYVGRRKIEDTVPPGDYDFKHAIERSSNSYFIQVGLQTGIDRIIELAEKFCLGERSGLTTRQETDGDLPDMRRIHSGWTDGDTANVCIGQGAVAVTPLQMAVVYSAIANGGTVFFPRLVARVESQDPVSGEVSTNFPSALVRDHIDVSGRSLRLVHDAMLGETEDAEGTGKAACVPGLRICGKTGTAQVQDSANRWIGYNFWFASFAPYENPRYAVIVMVQTDERSGSGGTTCAPIAHDIYEVISEKMKAKSGGTSALTALQQRQMANAR